MTGTLPDATNRPARLLAETRKRPCWIGQHYWPVLPHVARSELGAASARTLRKYQ